MVVLFHMGHSVYKYFGVTRFIKMVNIQHDFNSRLGLNLLPFLSRYNILTIIFRPEYLFTVQRKIISYFDSSPFLVMRRSKGALIILYYKGPYQKGIFSLMFSH